MPDTEAINLTEDLWRTLWAEIERSNARTSFDDWDSFRRVLTQTNEIDKHPISDERREIVEKMVQATIVRTNEAAGPSGEDEAFAPGNVIKMLEDGKEAEEVVVLAADDTSNWILRVRRVVKKAGDHVWDVEVSWGIEDALLQQSLSIPETYYLGKRLAMDWCEAALDSFHTDWHLGDSRFWLEAFKHEDASTGDTKVKERVHLNIITSG